ncbi:MAG: arylsulfatase [Tannerella sp.]|jgi:arylsulfatase A-like enzyme|nr:arylsulfatase [Tannerella sp.]
MRETVKSFGLGALAILPACLPAWGQAPDGVDAGRPNVIFIMADDLGIGDLGCYGQARIKTPAIDRLASNGMKFTRHYSGCTVSAPSRGVLLTGKHTGHACIRGNKGVTAPDGLAYDWPLAEGEITVADIFKQAGYATACIGKWGLGGPQSEGTPDRHGFDDFFGYLGQAHAHRYYPQFLWDNGRKIQLDGKAYSHDLIVARALDFIERKAGEPFFLYLTPTIPHADLTVPEGELGEYENLFAETPYTGKDYTHQPRPRATFAAMVARLDRDVARIMQLLDKKGLTENTIVIFTSDNGAHAEGGHDPGFFRSTGPFRGIKRDLYEGGIRTPFIVHWPAHVAKGSISGHVSAFWDFLPTTCALTGIQPPPGIDGISFLPALTGKGEQLRHGYLYWEFHERGGKRAILKDNWKLIELFVNKPAQTRVELYDLSSDPGETADLSRQCPEKVRELTALLHQARTPDSIWMFAGENPQNPLSMRSPNGGKPQVELGNKIPMGGKPQIELVSTIPIGGKPQIEPVNKIPMRGNLQIKLGNKIPVGGKLQIALGSKMHMEGRLRSSPGGLSYIEGLFAAGQFEQKGITRKALISCKIIPREA